MEEAVKETSGRRLSSEPSGMSQRSGIKKNMKVYYIDTSVLLENTALVKFIRNYIWDSSGVFSISSRVRISMTSFRAIARLKALRNAA